MARATFVKKARRAVPDAGIAVGDSYYWWKFRHGGKHYSKERPKRSQLTQSDFYSRMYDLEDDVIGSAEANDSLPGVRDDVVSQLEEIRDECEEKRDNMPEQLQDSDTGTMLQERYDALDGAVQEFEALELDEPDEDEFGQEWDSDNEDNDEDEEPDESREDFIARKVEEYWQEKLEEFQAVSIDYP
jgi:hypothetical protein